MKYVVCYSGGHSSAICAVEAVRRHGKENVILLNHDICERVEDADVKRFKKEVADRLGIEITYANMKDCETKDQFDVCMEIKAFKCGNQSEALCTNRLKTRPFIEWLKENYPSEPGGARQDITVLYGFDSSEQNRISRRRKILLSMGYMSEYPLSEWPRTIQKIEEIGIERPETYLYRKHANCSGCLKGGIQHWYVTYCLDPEIFEKAKRAEEQIGHSILRKGYLKEYEKRFRTMKAAGVLPTENIKSGKFWAEARRKIKDYFEEGGGWEL